MFSEEGEALAKSPRCQRARWSETKSWCSTHSIEQMGGEGGGPSTAVPSMGGSWQGFCAPLPRRGRLAGPEGVMGLVHGPRVVKSATTKRQPRSLRLLHQQVHEDALITGRYCGSQTSPGQGFVSWLPWGRERGTAANIVWWLSRVRLLATPWTAARQAPPSSTPPKVCSDSCPWSRWCHPTISPSSLLPPSPPAFHLSQHQGLF